MLGLVVRNSEKVAVKETSSFAAGTRTSTKGNVVFVVRTVDGSVARAVPGAVFVRIGNGVVYHTNKFPSPTLVIRRPATS